MVVSEYLKPKSLEEAYKNLIDGNKNHIIGGGAWIKLTYKSVNKLISLDELNLDYITEKDNSIEIGSMTSLRSIETNDLVKSLGSGILQKAISKIMGINIRNLATIGGSIMGKFSFSDILPVLLVLDAKLVFYKLGEMSIEEFIKTKRLNQDILIKIIIKKDEGLGFFKKVAITPLDFSILNLAVIKSNFGYKISFGATPYIAKLAKNTMEFLNHTDVINDTVLEKCTELMLEEISFSSNNKSSKEYKQELAKVYLKRAVKKVNNNVD